MLFLPISENGLRSTLLLFLSIFFQFFYFFLQVFEKKRRGQEVNIKMPNVLRKKKLMVLPCSAARPPGNVRKPISQLQGDSATCDAKKGHGVIMNIYYPPSTLKLSVSVLRLEKEKKVITSALAQKNSPLNSFLLLNCTQQQEPVRRD